MTISERLKFLRKNVLKMNQTEFADQLGISQNAISGYEQANRNISNCVIKSTCRTFNVCEEWLRDGTGEMFQGQANAAACSSINERIQYVRQLLNLTLEEFGKRIGVTKSAISRLENSSRGITNQMAISICREFDICEDWLRNGTGEIFQNQANAAVCSSINERIRYLRNDVLQLSQNQFSENLGLTQAGISYLEQPNKPLANSTIKTICLTYNVREEWLRNGTGEIFTPDSTLSPMETSLLSDFRALDIRGQAKVLDYIQDLMQAAAYRSSIHQPK